MEDQDKVKILEIEGRAPQHSKNTLRLDELSNLILRSSSFLINNLIDTNHQLVFTLNNDGSLVPSIYETDYALTTRPLKITKARPALYIEFPQRNEALRRQLFEKPRLIDYLGNDKAKLREIALSGDLKCKYRMQTLIDETDDQIAQYLGRNLYSTSLEKRPRINLDQLKELWSIIPHKAVHLANVLSFGSSLILHRRSQRLNSMARSNLTRIERLFYYHPIPNDGYYPFSFEPEREAEFINFILNETGTYAILKSHQKSQFEHYYNMFNLYQKDFKPLKEIQGLTVQESLNQFERKKFRYERKDEETLGDLIMPGNRMQKTFLKVEWSKIKRTPVEILKLLLTPSRVNCIPEPGSNGFLSKIGRLRVKKLTKPI
jgi:hypothetical protein